MLPWLAVAPPLPPAAAPIETPPDQEPPPAGADADDAQAAAAAADGATDAGAEAPPAAPEGELPASVWAGGRRLAVRWLPSARQLGSNGSLTTPSGGGVYVVVREGAPVAAHITRDFARDLRARLAAAGPRRPQLAIFYGRVPEAERLGPDGRRQIIRHVRRALGLPMVAPPRR